MLHRLRTEGESAGLDAQLASPAVRDRLRLLVAAGVVEIRRPAA